MIRIAIPLLLLFAPIASAAVAVGDSPELRGRAFNGVDVDSTKMRGKLVVIDFWIGRDAPNRDAEKSLVQIYNDYHAKGVEMIGVCCERRVGDVQRYVGELGITWPQIHEPADWRGGLGALWGVPQVNWDFLLGPDGKVLFAGEPGKLQEAIDAAMKDHPPTLVDPQILAKAGDDLDAVEKLLLAKDREGAIRRFTQVPDDATKEPKFADRAADVRGKVNEAADQLLGEVDTMIASKQFHQAAKRLSALLTTMAGLPTASLARQHLAELVAIPEIQSEMKQKERADAAEVALSEARRLRDAGKGEEAYVKFQTVATEFKDTPAASAAAEAVKAYDVDPAFQRRMKDQMAAPKARKMLNLADNYRTAGLIDEAKKRYQEVIDQFPGTSFADAARDELARTR